MRPLGFSSNAFKQDTLDHALNVLASIGYGAVELMADLHHAHPLVLDAARRRELAKRVADLGLIVSNVNAFTHFADGDTYHPTWFEPDPERTQLRIDHTNRCLEMAAELGARTVSVQPGGPVVTSGLSPGEAIERFAESLGRCVETARAVGVILAVEPEPGLLIESAGEYLGFKQRFFAGEPAVRMNCDVGHLFCVGDSPDGVIRAMPNEIAHVHIEDIGANRVHQHLTPGRGVMDFAAIFAALDAIDYAGHTTVELYPYASSAAGVARGGARSPRALDDLVEIARPGALRRSVRRRRFKAPSEAGRRGDGRVLGRDPHDRNRRALRKSLDRNRRLKSCSSEADGNDVVARDAAFQPGRGRRTITLVPIS